MYIYIHTIMSIGLGGAEAPSFVLRTAMEGTRSSVFGFAFGWCRPCRLPADLGNRLWDIGWSAYPAVAFQQLALNPSSTHCKGPETPKTL